MAVFLLYPKTHRLRLRFCPISHPKAHRMRLPFCPISHLKARRLFLHFCSIPKLTVCVRLQVRGSFSGYMLLVRNCMY